MSHSQLFLLKAVGYTHIMVLARLTATWSTPLLYQSHIAPVVYLFSGLDAMSPERKLYVVERMISYSDVSRLPFLTVKLITTTS